MQMELRVGGRFRLGRKIGSGSFGDIYLGKSEFRLLFFKISLLFITSRAPFEMKMKRCVAGSLSKAATRVSAAVSHDPFQESTVRVRFLEDK